MPDDTRRVDAADWHREVAATRASGAAWFDWLGAVDEIGREPAIRVVVRLAPDPDADGVRLETLVDRDEPRLDSIADVCAGAAWHEREVRDFFGVEFTGGDNRPLLLREGTVGRPLLRDAVLAARVVRPWPGAKDAGDVVAAGRRRMVPPGVPDAEVWGDRTGDPATAEEIAASVMGGRVRRRR